MNDMTINLALVDEDIKKENTSMFVAQRLIFPDPAVNSEPSLFYHRDGVQVGVDYRKQSYFALKKSTLKFDTYFNAFPAYIYDFQENNSLSISLDISGNYIIKVILARHGRSWETLFESLELQKNDEKIKIKIPSTVRLDGLIYIELVAVSDILVSAIDYCIEGDCARDVSITGVITTYKRDEAVQATGSRLQNYFDKNPDIAKYFNLLVIDNGGETDSVPFTKAKVIKNKNLGGAGGFTRGLLEIVDKKLSTHALFMDDDASFFPESLRRTLSILRFNSKSNLSISGAMISENHRWRMWENGATFNQRCIPMDSGRDLNRFEEVISLSLGQPKNIPNRYGAWWYFCFPVSEVKTWPFPFFVRGDDVYFSLSNNFDIINVLGVVAHQEDFSIKQSPMTIYLDVRNHIVQHLTFDDIGVDGRQLQKMVARFFHRYNDSYHYESAAAINQAIEDVLCGESFWEENLDMSDRRMLIGSITSQEKIKNDLPINFDLLTNHSPKRNSSLISKIVRFLTFNGHLIPDFFLHKKGVLFTLDVRGIPQDAFLRKNTVTYDQAIATGYICKRDVRTYFKNLIKFKLLSNRLRNRSKDLNYEYKKYKNTLTSKEVWVKRFEH